MSAADIGTDPASPRPSCPLCGGSGTISALRLCFCTFDPVPAMTFDQFIAEATRINFRFTPAVVAAIGQRSTELLAQYDAAAATPITAPTQQPEDEA